MFVLLASLQVEPAQAELPYQTKTSDVNGAWVDSPNAFLPGALYKGFAGVEDLFITPDDHLFVVETPKNRIVELSPEGKVLRYVPAVPPKGVQMKPEEQLRRPEGVFVDEEGNIYIADTGSRRIAVFNKSGSFLRDYAAPDSELLPSTFIYAPSKVTVDKRGYLYIVTKGGYQGLLQLTTEGEFAGFFGANKVPFSWIDSLKRRFYTEEQLMEEQKRLPGAITNMAMNAEGFLYTVNKDMKQGQLRQLNFGGIDLLKDHDFAPWVGPLERFSYQDVHVDENGVMTVIESSGGRVYQYDKNGHMLFIFGNATVGQERLG
ncbi:MAG: nuclease, partial [Paenibacillus sp.]|nr:nuclease [Paenibacillus sp.]